MKRIFLFVLGLLVSQISFASSWTKLPKGPLTSRTAPLIAASDNEVFIFGGEGWEQTGNVTFGAIGDGALFNFKTQKWTPLPPAPPDLIQGGIMQTAAVWSGQDFIFYGGAKWSRTNPAKPNVRPLSSDKGYEFRSSKIEPGWGPIPTFTFYDPGVTPDSSFNIKDASVFFDKVSGQMLIWGGDHYVYNGLLSYAFRTPTFEFTRDIASRVTFYDVKKKTWRQSGPGVLVFNRDDQPRAAWDSVQRKLYVVVYSAYSTKREGQFKAHEAAVYDMNKDTWQSLPDFPENFQACRNGSSLAAINGRFIIWGGFGPLDSHSDGIMYDSKADKWIPLSPSPLSKRAGAATAVLSDNTLFVGFGSHSYRDDHGWGREDFYNDAAIFNPETNSWKLLPQSPLSARTGVAIVNVGNKIFLWGGRTGSPPDGFAKDGAVLSY